MERSKEARHTGGRRTNAYSERESQEKSSGAGQETRGPLESPATLRRPSRPPAHSQAQGQRQGVGPLSLRGLLAVQRFSKTLRARAAQNIARKKAQTRKPAVLVQEQIPAGSARPTELFPCAQVSVMLQDFLSSRLEGVRYGGPRSSGGGGALAAALSDEVRDLVKAACPARYRLVCTVSLRQRGPDRLDDGGLLMASRCLWDQYTDTWVSHTYRNRELVCVVGMFAVYCE